MAIGISSTPMNFVVQSTCARNSRSYTRTPPLVSTNFAATVPDAGDVPIGTSIALSVSSPETTVPEAGSRRDHDKVRNFFIKYQDRLLYGTDLTLNPDGNAADFKREAHEVWTRDWRYLATDESQRVEIIKADVRGLALPRAVIDKIYYGTSKRAFAL